MRQRGLTIITEIKEDKVEELRSFLNKIGEDIKRNPWIRFEKLTLVHFMRWAILPSEMVQGKLLPPQLVLSTNFDGRAIPHLEELVACSEKGIRAIYEHCHKCPKERNRKSMVEYLYQHKLKNSAFYVGAMGRSVQQIQNEAHLMEDIQNHLEKNIPQQERTAKSNIEFKVAVTERFFSLPGMQWIWKNQKPPFLVRYGAILLTLQILAIIAAFVALWILFPLAGIVVSGFIILVIGLLWSRLRLKESKETKGYSSPIRDGDRLDHLGKRENFKVQNQITHIAAVKKGFTRLFILKFILWGVNFLSKYIFNKGNLNGIHSIHFARWVLIDKGKRLLFFSNFDGSWESYLGEFVDRAFIGLTSVWSNTEDFPPTKYLVQGGARRSREFKTWSRDKQIETQVWYSAYHTLSLNNVLNNTSARQKLIKSLNEGKFQEFLQKI